LLFAFVFLVWRAFWAWVFLGFGLILLVPAVVHCDRIVVSTLRCGLILLLWAFGVGSFWKGKELLKGQELLKGNC
jgi:hypothetical protein